MLLNQLFEYWSIGWDEEMRICEVFHGFSLSGWNSYEMIMTCSSMFLAPSNISSSSVDLRCCAFVACLEVEVTGGAWNVGCEVNPIQSMYGIFSIFAYTWLIFMVNIGRYTIHGCYGNDHGEKKQILQGVLMTLAKGFCLSSSFRPRFLQQYMHVISNSLFFVH